jgi:hypothetical protein
MRMPVDGLPGTPEDQPGTGDAKPDEQDGSETQCADGPSQVTETRDRIEYYVALRTADQQASNPDYSDRLTRDVPSTSAWDDVPAADYATRPRADSLTRLPERISHILDGDRWGGGHRHGTGRPGKTEFPAGWDDKRIIDHVVDVARIPDATPVLQPNHRWRVHGERDGVGITVIVHPDGRIWSAWPEEGSPGVVRNPTEGRR